MIDDILKYNKSFVAEKAYEPFITDKYPAKKLAILTCMDTRLTVLLQEALGLKNGDAKIIKNAGGTIPSETDSAIRSLLVAIYELGVNNGDSLRYLESVSLRATRNHIFDRGYQLIVNRQSINNSSKPKSS